MKRNTEFIKNFKYPIAVTKFKGDMVTFLIVKILILTIFKGQP